MAALAKTVVTTRAAYREGGMVGKRFVTKEVTLVLTGQGDNGSNNIPASVFNFRKILKSSTAVRSDNTEVLGTSPSASGANLLLVETDGTIATRTGTYLCVLSGYTL